MFSEPKNLGTKHVLFVLRTENSFKKHEPNRSITSRNSWHNLSFVANEFFSFQSFLKQLQWLIFFLVQSSVCLKMLVYDLLELLLLSAFPELDATFKKLQEERHKFGELKVN